MAVCSDGTLLQEFHWLRSNGHCVREGIMRTGKVADDEVVPAPPELEEWRKRSAKFDQMTQAVGRLFSRLTFVPNRSLLYDLYPYIWDIKGVISLLNSYVKWIGEPLYEVECPLLGGGASKLDKPFCLERCLYLASQLSSYNAQLAHNFVTSYRCA